MKKLLAKRLPQVRSLIRTNEEIKKLDKKVLEIISQDKQVKRFMMIPGIGPITALTYKIEIFDPRRFKKAKSVGAYLGMTPTQ